MSYFTWHEEPGYWRDVTRHFDPAAAVLDVGCGTGWLARHFTRYTGIDGSPDAVGAAASAGRDVIQGDVSGRLPFADSSFDGVIIKDLLEHVADPAGTVREALRVLRPGGLVFASSPDAQRWVWNDYTHRRPFTRVGYRRLFADQRFEVVHCGYEAVMPGTSIVAARTRAHRRPALLRAAAWLPCVRRNVWILARRPATS
ncbi:MAG: class I SAM-dependent methyltransferase [Solirubrobacteraceae bacterium]